MDLWRQASREFPRLQRIHMPLLLPRPAVGWRSVDSFRHIAAVYGRATAFRLRDAREAKVLLAAALVHERAARQTHHVLRRFCDAATARRAAMLIAAFGRAWALKGADHDAFVAGQGRKLRIYLLFERAHEGGKAPPFFETLWNAGHCGPLPDDRKPRMLRVTRIYPPRIKKT